MNANRFFLFLFTLALVASASAQAPLNGIVREVPDGRTIVVDTENGSQFLIQLPFIETPTPEQSDNPALTRHLSDLLLNKRVAVTVVGIDGQINVGFVALNDVDVGMQMVRDGAAWFWPSDPAVVAPVSYGNYQANEAAAKAEKVGVWGIPNLVQPSTIRNFAMASANPFTDSEIAKLAIANLGPSVEGVFGDEVYSLEQGDCSGKVVSVIDGDTVSIQTSSGRLMRVRLEGIDAPEKAQAYGDESKEHLSKMILGRTVQCSSKKKDRYGRSIGTISLNGVNVNLQMVRDCYAWHYTAYQNEQSSSDRASFSAADSSCKSARLGLWANGRAMAPWEFRKYQFLAIYKPSSDAYDSYNYGSSYYSGDFIGGSSGGRVHVNSYFRSDGTFVHSHTRSSPRR
jgi:endonuclease YncB( thermonuclease family)